MLRSILPDTDDLDIVEQREYYAFHHQWVIDSLMISYDDLVLADDLNSILHIDECLVRLAIAIVKKNLSVFNLAGILTVAADLTMYLDRMVVKDLSLTPILRQKMKRSLGTTRVVVIKMISALALLMSERVGDSSDMDDLMSSLYEEADLFRDPIFQMMALCYRAMDGA